VNIVEYLGKVEKFLLAHIKYAYAGKIYYSSTSSDAKDFLASMFAEEFISPSERMYQKLKEAFKDGFKKLQEYWMIEISGYTVGLTSYGEQVVNNIKEEDYEKLKEDISKGNI